MTEPNCPRCKTTKYTNPSLKLMVNVCGHTLCENCVQTLYVQGSGKCYECNVVLRRNNFRIQQFEDPTVERDIDIRRRILKDFNKKEEDFNTLREYNDYLELIETIVYNIVNDIDREWTSRQIEEYKAANQEFIKRNRGKLARDLQELNDLIEDERREMEMNRYHVQKEASDAKQRKVRQKDELINELMLSDRPAEHIVQTHMDVTNSASTSYVQPRASYIPPTTKPPVTFNRFNQISDAVRVPVKTAEGTVPVNVTPTMFTYEPLVFDFMGPSPPSGENLSKHLCNVRRASSTERGGGFESSIACERALQDAFAGLYFTSNHHQNMSLDQ